MANENEKNEINMTPEQEKPKKKKPIMIFRPQNSKTGMVKSGTRPGAGRKPGAAPAAGARPAGTGTRPAGAAAGGTRTAGAAGSAKPPVQRPAAASAETPRPRRNPNIKGPDSEAMARAAAAQKAQAKQAAAQAERNARITAAREAEAEAAAKEKALKEAAAAERAAKEQAERAAALDAAITKAPAPAPVQEEKPAAPVPEKEAAPVEMPVKEAADSRTETAAPRSAAAPVRQAKPAEAAPRQAAPERRTAPARSAERPAARGAGREAAGSRDGAGARGTQPRREPGVRPERPERTDRIGAPLRGRAAAARGEGGSARPGASRDGRDSRDTRGDQGRGSRTGAAAAAPAKTFDKDTRRGAVGKKKGAPDRGDKFDRMESKSAGKGQGKPKNGKAAPKPLVKPVKEEEKIRSITLPETISVKDLADKMKIAAAQIVKKLFMAGKMVTVNEEISYEEAEEIALEYEILCEKEEKIDVIEELLKDTEDPEDSLVARPPVVCVMGHVDHGKTSLLDAIRDTHVTDRESGGITQHIGASVVTCNGQRITFLDTPGHEAFTSMRMRGANSTDIAILVVAADDGVMPQTVEAINHAKAAGIEIIVAINKIDKPGANVDKVKQELTEYQLIPEDWGGSTVFVPVSAKTREGIDTLLEMILLTSEVLELKANPNRRARGLVIEARLDKGRGPVATVLIQKGTLHAGDPICAGSCYGRIRIMQDDKGRALKEAGPSTPVEIVGFSDVPGAGEIMISPQTEKEARTFAETFISEGKQKLVEESRRKMSLDDLYSQIQAGNLKELNLIVKADVQGSVEAVRQSLEKLSNEEIVVKTIHSGAGAINESDIVLASASNAIIIGFNVKIDPQAKATADQEGVDVRLYSVIYNAIEDVERAMKGMLDPIYEEKILGHAEVRQLFRASGVGTIAGSYVLDGVFQRGCKARITRGKDQIFDGNVASLKRFKDDVKEVKAGYECGLVFEKFNDLQEGDQIEAYMMVEVPRV